MRPLTAFTSALCLIFGTALVHAEPARPEAKPIEPPEDVSATPPEPPDMDFMHVLASRGLHDIEQERWNAYGQVSLIGHYRSPLAAKYTNLNGSSKSLLPAEEGSWTGTATLYLGAKLWPGAEAYVVPEVVSERPLSNLAGLGGAIQNGELQKSGGAAPTIYLARAYLQQTIALGGEAEHRESGQMQLGTTVRSRRLVITLGKFSTIDFLDKNTFAGDIRRQFLNIAFMTHAAWDFAADARGYTWGAVVEGHWDAYTIRAAHTMVPINPNDLDIDFRFWKFYGDQLEIERAHHLYGSPGAVRLLGYRNHENMGVFKEAVAAYDADPRKNAAACTGYHYDSTNRAAPDLCWVRRPTTKVGLGINVEQALGDKLGVFARGMYSDGKSEVYAYMSADASLSFGALAKGTWWGRPLDSLGAGMGLAWISNEHAEYLGRGGVDGFIGDGAIRHAMESVFEVFYSVRVLPPLWLTVDYQHITHPAYNADRGPLDLVGGRLHVEI